MPDVEGKLFLPLDADGEPAMQSDVDGRLVLQLDSGGKLLLCAIGRAEGHRRKRNEKAAAQ